MRDLMIYSRDINVDISYRCTLFCGGCNRQDEDYTIVKKEMTIAEFEKIISVYSKVLFCGGQSDPIFHPHFIEFLRMSRERGITVCVHTAASHKKREWYLEAFDANPHAKWYFGIDGLPKDSHKYRINQDGEYLFQRMIDAKERGLEVEWQHINFDYNKDTREEVRLLAEQHNIRLQFLETNTNVKGKNVKLVYDLSAEVQPRCLNKTTPMYYSAGGHLLPCCWLDSKKEEVPELFDESLTLNNKTVQEIITSDVWTAFNEKLKTDPHRICRKRCGINHNQEDAKMKRTFVDG